ncbi:MAG: SRPBCC family protein [Blastocatellia bacterium]
MAKIRNEKVNFKTLIRVQPERAFDAISTGAGLNEWFTTGATVDLRPGGEIRFRWKDWGLERYTGETPGKVVEVRRPERYVFQWRADSGTYDTTVEITFEPVAEGTVVKLAETGYEDTPAGMQDLLNRVSGWAQVLTLMKFYLEHGVKY